MEPSGVLAGLGRRCRGTACGHSRRGVTLDPIEALRGSTSPTGTGRSCSGRVVPESVPRPAACIHKEVIEPMNDRTTTPLGRISRRQAFGLAGAGVGIALTASACGGGGSGSDAASGEVLTGSELAEQ